MFERFTHLGPPRLRGIVGKDTYEFLINYHEKLYNLGLIELYGVAYNTYQLRDITRDQWRSLISCIPFGSPEMTLDQFAEALLDRFIPCNLRDQSRDEFDYLQKGSIIIAEYKACFYFQSRYSYDSISTESEKIQKSVKGLDVSLQLATSQMVVLGAPFQSIVDHTKMTEDIISVSQ